MGVSIAVRITINTNFNKGGNFNRRGKRSNIGGDSASIKLYGYQQYLYY